MTKYNNDIGFNRLQNRHENNVIYFIRHGECITNTGQVVNNQLSDILTARGEQQSVLCGKAIKNILDINQIALHTSRMKRAIQTGKIIGQTIDIPITNNDDRLNEISHCNRDLKNGKLHYINVFKRIDEVIYQIVSGNHKNTNIIITHQGVLELLICRVISQYYTGIELPNINISAEADFKIHTNTGISCFSLNVDGKINGLISWNNHNHLNFKS